MDNPVSNPLTVVTPQDYVPPDSRSTRVRERRLLRVFTTNHLDPETLGLMERPLIKAGKHGSISKDFLLQSKATFFLIKSDGILVNKMDFPFLQSGTPDEVSLGFKNIRENLTRKRGVLYYIGGNIIKGGFSKRKPTSHVQVLGFPTVQLVIEIISNELIIPITRSLVKDRESKVLTK